MVAVSGGADSLCLLHILRRLVPRLQLELVAAHLNHGFRPESAGEAEKVRQLAAAWSIPFESAAISVPEFMDGQKLSAEEAARIVRYRFLLETAKKHGSGKIALGHQSDDQAETVLFHLLRGTGPDGLAGMLPRRDLGSVQLVRPLLGVARREIEQYCRVHGLEPACDSSNFQTVYTRNRIRLELIPHLEERYNPRIKESLSRLASLAAADRKYLQEAAGRIFKSLAVNRGDSLILDRRVLAALPEALQGRVARQALEFCLSGKKIGWRQVQQILKLAGPGPARKVDLPGGVRLYRSYGKLYITAEPPVREPAIKSRVLQIPGDTILPDGSHIIRARLEDPADLAWPPPPERACLDFNSIPGPLVLRSRRPGERFHPHGAAGKKKLKDFFIDQKVPLHRRAHYPLVAAGEEIVWGVGLRIAHPYRITGDTEQALVLEYRNANENENVLGRGE